jgi:anti-sigma regulatory factor (Ser/Thr protein kinase)
MPVGHQIETLPKAARELVAKHLPRWGLAALVEDAQIVASELVTNAVKCASCGTVGFALKCSGDVLCVEVQDSSPTEPVLRQAGSEEESGRGLQLVEFLSDTWGFHWNSHGTKTTWCSLRTGSAADGD